MKSNNRSLLIVAILAFLLTGCMRQYGQFGYPPLLDGHNVARGQQDASPNSYGKIMQVDLTEAFERMATDLCEGPCSGDGGPAPAPGSETTVMVADFVDLQSYTPYRSGKLMGELMRTSVNRVCRYAVVQAELSSYLRLSDRGLTALTRDPNLLKSNQFPYGEYIIGTYNITPDKLIIFAKKVNSRTGKISRSSTMEIAF